MTGADLLLLTVVVALPALLGAVAAFLGKPWWWAAMIAAVLAVIALVAPTPEPGEARLAAGDLGFLAVVCLVVALLTWLGSLLGRQPSDR